VNSGGFVVTFAGLLNVYKWAVWKAGKAISLILKKTNRSLFETF
jgi:hypothetical protein